MGSIADVPAPREVTETSVSFHGRVWDVRTDVLNLDGDTQVTRDYVDHTGAVVVLALNDADEVFLLRQYRHPVRRELWEAPAGLLDVPGESPLDAAKRELWEEADLEASTWNVLLDIATSPGGSSECVRIFLARDVTTAHADNRHDREDEERDMEGRWVPLGDVLESIMRGQMWNGIAIAGAFALDSARRHGWASLRPADAHWDFTPGRASLR
jgi:ADP-ribose pyrophosphatase